MNRSRPSYQQYSQTCAAYQEGLKTNTAATRLALAWGPSDFLLLQTRQQSKKQWLAGPDRLYQLLHGKELGDAEAFRALWEQQSMFSEAPFYDLPGLEAHKSIPKLLALLPRAEALTSPLLLSYQGDRIPAALQQEMNRLKAYLIPCFAPFGRELTQFLKNCCRDEGVKIDDRGLSFMQEALGQDLFKLANEIKKLALIYAGAKQVLGPDELAPYLAVLRQEHAFRLTELLLTRKHAQAHTLTLDLLRRGESAIAILGILARHLRQSIQLAAAARLGGPAAAVRLPYNVLKSYNAYTPRLRMPKVHAALALCQQADVALKSSRQCGDELVLAQVLDAIATMEH